MLYLERTSPDGEFVDSFNHIPCLSYWGDEEIGKRLKCIKALGGFASKRVRNLTYIIKKATINEFVLCVRIYDFFMCFLWIGGCQRPRSMESRKNIE